MDDVSTLSESLASFDSSLITTILDGVLGAATLVSELTVTNTSPGPITLHLFNYLDADVGDTFTGDSASLLGGDTTLMQVADTSVFDTVQYRAEESIAYQVTVFASLRSMLEDGDVTTLDNSGLPFAPGDFTGAFQWTLDLAPGESATVCATFGVNDGAPECGGSAGPDFVRGDFDGNGMFNGLIDALAALDFQFGGADPPICAEASDADGDGAFNGLIDALYMLAHQFQGADPPPAPYPMCGQDPDPAGSLGCAPNGCP